MPSPTKRRFLAAGIAALILLTLAGAAFVAGPGRGIRQDIARQRDDIHATRKTAARQLATMRRQLRGIRRQLETTRALLRTTRDQRRLAHRGVALTRLILDEARATRADADALTAIANRLLVIAELILDEVREINAKTGGDVPERRGPAP